MFESFSAVAIRSKFAVFMSLDDSKTEVSRFLSLISFWSKWCDLTMAIVFSVFS